MSRGFAGMQCDGTRTRFGRPPFKPDNWKFAAKVERFLACAIAFDHALRAFGRAHERPEIMSRRRPLATVKREAIQRPDTSLTALTLSHRPHRPHTNVHGSNAYTCMFVHGLSLQASVLLTVPLALILIDPNVQIRRQKRHGDHKK